MFSRDTRGLVIALFPELAGSDAMPNRSPIRDLGGSALYRAFAYNTHPNAWRRLDEGTREEWRRRFEVVEKNLVELGVSLELQDESRQREA